MTDEPVNHAPHPKTEGPDWFLQTLVEMTNDTTIAIGITLQVSGFLVSGELVGGPMYFEAFASEFSSVFSSTPEVAASIKENLAGFGGVYEKDKECEEMPKPQYVHLRNAHFFSETGAPLPGNRGVWWRGRLSEVGGFFLGSLNPKKG